MNTNGRRRAATRMLAHRQVEQVHEYALRLLEESGCSVQCEEARDILGAAGCDLRNPDRVRIPRKLVQEAIEASPRSITIHDGEGKPALVLDEGACYYGTGSDCPATIDLATGERRSSTKDDVGRLARFCDALPNIDFVMSFAIANDARPGFNFVDQLEAMILNTAKPIIVTGHGRNDMRTMIEMAAAAAGGIGKLREKPSLVLYTEPLSPLIHTEIGVGKGLVCCEHGIPFIYIGSPMMGATGPASLEGTLVQAVAEGLSGLVIFQKKQPGAKFIFGGDATVMDMRATVYSYGAPELSALNAALADMAHFYGLPFFCIAGTTDSKVLDAQAGLEYAISLLEATRNGCNIIHDCGYLESGLTSSFESVLFADEVISMVKRLLRPPVFDDASVSMDLFRRVGPSGSYLMDEDTVNHFREHSWFPRFLDRRNVDAWRKEGSQELPQVLSENARRMFEPLKPRTLPATTVRAIRDIAERHQPDVR